MYYLITVNLLLEEWIHNTSMQTTDAEMLTLSEVLLPAHARRTHATRLAIISAVPLLPQPLRAI